MLPEFIGNLVPNLIIGDVLIVDPKVVACFTETHVAQSDRVFKHYWVKSRAFDQF